MSVVLSFTYGVVYRLLLAAYAYAMGFVSNVLVPGSIDTGPTAPFGQALLSNVGLLSLFAVQHSVMA